MTAKERETLLRGKLAANGYEPERIKSEDLDYHEWWMRIELHQRTFVFGSVIRDGFSFSELRSGKEISFMRHLSGTVHFSEDAAIKASADMVVYCLIHPEFTGCDQPVI
jgi:hypothetical protein